MKVNAANELLYSISKDDRSKIAIYSSQGHYSYSQYIEEVNKYQEVLIRIYGKRNIRIGIIMDDCVEFIFLFWACLKIGIVPILINNKFTLETIGKSINSIGLKNILIKKNDKIKHDLLENRFAEIATYNQIHFLQKKEYSYKKESLLEKEIAFGIFTSGTTNVPKCVMHTHVSMIRCVNSYYKNMIGIRKNDIIYSASKMMHTYGLGNTVFQTVGVRAASIVCDEGSVYSIIENIQKYRPTVLFAVPTVYKELIRIKQNENIELSSLRMCFSAGEHLDKSIYKEFYLKFGCEILDGMGNTEYLTTFITNTLKDHKVGSCGKSIPGFEAKIVNDKNIELSNGKVGRLLVKGNIHFLRYYGNNKKVSSEDYFDTENLCYKDDDGFIWYVGRKSILYKIRGRWVNPIEIEQILNQMDEIEETLVVKDSIQGLDDSTLYIKIKEDLNRDIEKDAVIHKIKVILKRNLEHYKCPTKFVFVKHIPKGATGKKIRKKIGKEYYLGDQL